MHTNTNSTMPRYAFRAPSTTKSQEPLFLQIGIKKMLHLIWHKDNNSSTAEDGKEQKGIRSQLLECYRKLYFDPLPDTTLEAKAQVNRITKNMIE